MTRLLILAEVYLGQPPFLGKYINDFQMHAAPTGQRTVH